MEESTVISGTSSEDVINISKSGSVYGYGGDDTINIKSSNVFAKGGSGDDLFVVNAYYSSRDLTDITITGGEGKDTIQFRPDVQYYSSYNDLGIVITDFSNKDVIRFDGSDYYYSDYYTSHIGLTQKVENGNVVIRDNVSISSDKSGSIKPTFSVTLQGVSDISQVADAKYYRYSYGSLSESKTLGELFSVTSDDTKESVDSITDTDTTSIVTISGGSTDTLISSSATDTALAATDTTPPVTISGAIGSTVPTVINYGNNSNATVAATITTAGGTNDTVLMVDSSFVGGGSGDTILAGPVIIDSSVEGGIGNTYYVTINVGTLEINNNYYTYEGGYRFLQDYTQGQVIQLDSDYRGIDLFGNNFIVKSGTGQLEIQDARDKVISYSGSNGVVTAYSYVASDEGNINGSAMWRSQIDILIGADNKNNKITGGYGSSSLWGGGGQSGNDTLIGGSSYNEFFYAVGNGNDVIQNANSNDLINLASVRLSQITRADVYSGEVNIRFNDGGSLRVLGSNNVAYQTAEGTYSYNQYSGKWTQR